MVFYILKKIIIIIVLFKFNDIFFYKKWDIWFKCFFKIKVLIGKKVCRKLYNMYMLEYIYKV